MAASLVIGCLGGALACARGGASGCHDGICESPCSAEDAAKTLSGRTKSRLVTFSTFCVCIDGRTCVLRDWQCGSDRMPHCREPAE